MDELLCFCHFCLTEECIDGRRNERLVSAVSDYLIKQNINDVSSPENLYFSTSTASVSDGGTGPKQEKTGIVRQCVVTTCRPFTCRKVVVNPLKARERPQFCLPCTM
jgi:hypothetical protein